jgi:hypothetical protein
MENPQHKVFKTLHCVGKKNKKGTKAHARPLLPIPCPLELRVVGGCLEGKELLNKTTISCGKSLPLFKEAL